jgi:bile acid:Na+ symporter, BASS family
MRLQNAFTQIFLPFAVVLVMFALGTTLAVSDLRRVLARPRAFFLGLLAHAFLLPAVAFGVARVLDLPGPLAVGLVLIASCPANAASNLFTHLARGDTMLSICLTAAASLTSVATVPAFVNLALRRFPAGHDGVDLPVLPAALGLFLVSTIPVLLGMALRHARPGAARAVETRLGAFGLAIIAAVIVGAVWSEKGNVLPALAQAGVAALVLNLSSVSLAWGLSGLFGLDRAQRIAVGLECGLQNFAMAAFIALTLMSDARLLLPAMAYGLTMWLSAGAVVLVMRRAPARPDTIAR